MQNKSEILFQKGIENFRKKKIFATKMGKNEKFQTKNCPKPPAGRRLKNYFS